MFSKVVATSLSHPDDARDPTLLPALLTVENVKARYHLRDSRAARNIVRQAGAITVAGRLFVRRDALERWEASRQEHPRSQVRATPDRRRSQRRPSPSGVLAPGWWKEA